MKDEGKKEQIKRKATALSEAFIMILSTFAFAFILGGMIMGISISAVEEVKAEASATNWISVGCCLEAKNGNKCQNMNPNDASLCKEELVLTNCELVESCQSGCCYNPRLGQCSLNSPKSICTDSNGNWSSNAQCLIPECSLGCCILADQASITTTRECTRLSEQLDFKKNFQALDADGTCNSKTNLDIKGACLTRSSDYSGKNDCRFTTKGACKTGTFYENYLCTSKELNTNCKPAKNTTCLQDKDQVYYVDSCGNPANVYDAKKFKEDNYWDHIISPSAKAVCQTPNSDCGNCDYMSGSVCGEYRNGRDTQPTFGNNVCRDLNCENGRKHGESWCVYDTNPNDVAPVGSRHFMASCMEGEISIQGCADFNQEVCAENTDATTGLTEARCFTNDWRTCLSLNNKASYALVKVACADNPQCVMLDSRYGSSNLLRSDSVYFAGFKTDILNIYQGAADDVGTSQNLYPVHCVPKYTPGFQFWTTSNTSSGSSDSYGGSTAETNAMCAIGNFICVSNMKRECELAGGVSSEALCAGTVGLSSLVASDPKCENWKDVYNWECNVDGVHTTINSTDLPKFMNAMNERCRNIGSCGISSSISGDINTINSSNSFTITRMKMDATGETSSNLSTGSYVPSASYINSIKRGITSVTSLAQLTKGNNILGSSDVDSGQTSAGNPSGTAVSLATLIAGFDVGQEDLADFEEKMTLMTALLGLVGLVGGWAISGAGAGAVAALPAAGSSAGWYAFNSPALQTLDVAPTSTGGTGTGGSGAGGSSGALAGAGAVLVGAALGYTAGYYIGKMIINNQDWSPGQQVEFMEGISSFGAALGAVLGYIYAIISLCATVVACIPALIIMILVMAYSVYENCFGDKYDEKQYYVLSYQCKAWEPPDEGDCSLCNNDVRPCSEYRCRSLGDNCQYYNSNGEPGHCASLSDTWSATITPWKEALSEDLKYSEVKSNGFKIESKTGNGKVHAWENLEFGIITNEPSQCKLDIEHTESYDEMAYSFEVSQESEEGCISESCTQGTHHSIVLSPHVSAGGGGTPPLIKNAENNYYIRCKNFAGSTNAGEFAVKIFADNGEDLTPPLITRFVPASDSYVKLGSNSSHITFYVNEPSTCRYSIGRDNRYEDMTQTANCLTNPNSGIMGEWACYTLLNNLTIGENKFYFQCQDKPKAAATERKNINRNSKEYILKGCSTGVNITKLEPKNTLITGKSPIAMTVKAETSGCVDNGRAVCSYKLGAGSYISFFNTNSKIHNQVFTSMPSGNHTLEVKCEDDAKNVAYSNLSINVYIDDNPPIVSRTYIYDRKLSVITNEKAECKFTNNASVGCSFDYGTENNQADNSSSAIILMSTEITGKWHYANYKENNEYYIKCKDGFGNINSDCAIVVKAV